MSNLPTEIRLTNHAKQRLIERKNAGEMYNVKNLMDSSIKWYGKEDLIETSPFYAHCCYTIRKSSQMGYITDGNIEVVYNKVTQIAITVLEVKDKFKPITQYIKPEILKRSINENEKENKEIMKDSSSTETCRDCGKTDVEVISVGIYAGVCTKCKSRIQNAKMRGKEYIPYLQLSDKEKMRIDALQQSHAKRKEKEVAPLLTPSVPKQVIENYYQAKAENDPTIAHAVDTLIVDKPVAPKLFDPLSDQMSFINILKNNGCDIPESSLEDVLDVLINMSKLKDMLMIATNTDNKQVILDLEKALMVVEKKLQYDWECNGFQEADDIKFKGFLTWRRTLKDAISFWKKLNQTNMITELQCTLNTCTQNVDNKIKDTDNTETMKCYKVTTESISNTLNTRRPFVRMFYAPDRDTAYEMFKQWMATKNLQETPEKTTIVELKNVDKN